PKSAVIPFELGRYYCKSENPKAKKYLLRATEINSNNADIWNLLSIDALRWGDDEGRLKYLKKAIAVAPNNPQYYIGYLYSLEGIPKLKSDSIALDVFLRFKGMPDGAKALAFLAKNASSTE